MIKNKKIEQALIGQIKNEEHSSRLYMAMASWCHANGFHGASKYLFKQSDEERAHMLKIVNYVNERGGHATLSELDNLTDNYKTLIEVFEKILKHEEFITTEINNLYEESMKSKDYATATFIQWFITEQLEEESTFQDILDKMRMTGSTPGGVYWIDRELAMIAAGRG
ncbi:MAG: ferritin [Bacteroidetes bacterium]|nr:ferritin [Bacteroidota bacterium]